MLSARERAVAEPLLARCTFPAAATAVTCAVSGGADSCALLVLAVAAGCTVTAVHVDHRLRPGSAGEADLVRVLADRVGASFVARSVAVTAGPNLEARARDARRSVLPAGALTGHTLDDQAETVVLNLLRGSGRDGLAGMRSATKPMLGLRRQQTRALCAALGIEPFDDPSNRDLALRRNRVRATVLPLLDDVAERDVAPVLARQAALLRDEADLLDALAADIDGTDCRALAGSPPALARRAVRQAFAVHRPDAAAVERLLAVARGESKATEVRCGVRVARRQQRLVVDLPPPEGAR
jgi:tRNA(Ile)-lysidine synthase